MIHYCPECGAKLIFEKRYIDRYDMETGRQLVTLRKYCPNRKWWNSGHFENENIILETDIDEAIVTHRAYK